MPLDSHTPNPIDVHVGARVRMRRKFVGMSQTDLADALKLTFQQVQKYERGSNRMSASKLHETAKALKTSVSSFFDGYSEEAISQDGFDESAAEKAVHSFLATTEGIELSQSFPLIKSGRKRRKILELVQTLADSVD